MLSTVPCSLKISYQNKLIKVGSDTYNGPWSIGMPKQIKYWFLLSLSTTNNTSKPLNLEVPTIKYTNFLLVAVGMGNGCRDPGI